MFTYNKQCECNLSILRTVMKALYTTWPKAQVEERF